MKMATVSKKENPTLTVEQLQAKVKALEDQVYVLKAGREVIRNVRNLCNFG